MNLINAGFYPDPSITQAVDLYYFLLGMTVHEDGREKVLVEKAAEGKKDHRF